MQRQKKNPKTMWPGLLDNWTGELMEREGYRERERSRTDGATENTTKKSKNQKQFSEENGTNAQNS